jgi:hypothetical protein
MKRQWTAHIFSFLVIFSMLLSLAGMPIIGVKAASTITFSAEELLARPTATSIMINVVPDEDVNIYYEYDTEPTAYTQQSATGYATAGEPYNVVISGLSPDTQYYYRMQYQKPEDAWVARSEHSFHTQRLPGETFTFTMIADSHMSGGGGNVSLYQQTLANVAAEKPDFHLDLGDSFWTDGVSNSSMANQRFLAQRQWMSAVNASAAIFVAPGNHENLEGWNFDDTDSLALLSLNAQKRYYPNPIPDSFYSGNPDTSLTGINGDHLREDYFAWTWGDALFIVIDPYQYTLTKPYPGTAGGEVDDEGPASSDNWDWTLGLDQFNWLKTTLESSTAKYKFVFAHHMVGGLPAYYYVRGGAEAANLYEWGGYNSNGTVWGFDAERPGWGGIPIHQMMVANSVSAFFYGHDHEYAYQERDGVVYQLVPAPSMSGYGFGLYKETDPHTIRVLPNSGHLRITVSSTQATVDYIATSTAEVNYRYTIQPNSSGTTHDLTIAVNPSGSGTVISSPGGIDCGYDCSETYPEGTSVTLTATPTDHYSRFTGWSGTGISCPGTGACTVEMTTSKTVTAEFEKATFSDVPYDYSVTYGGVVYPLHDHIQALYNAGYTDGCSTEPLAYCPEATLTRVESAVFMLRGLLGTSYAPPTDPSGYVFTDDWSSPTVSWGQSWAEGMWDEGLTAGCQASPLLFCPTTAFTRAEASVFGLRIENGAGYTPPAASHIFADDWSDPTLSWAEPWAEQAYLDGLSPACGESGGKPLFCPVDLVTRAWAAYLVVQAKDLPMTP